MENGRLFNDLNETVLRTALANHPQLELVRVWIAEDVRKDRRGRPTWLNAIVRRYEQLARSVPKAGAFTCRISDRLAGR
jgi:hypothetical protein